MVINEELLVIFKTFYINMGKIAVAHINIKSENADINKKIKINPNKIAVKINK